MNFAYLLYLHMYPYFSLLPKIEFGLLTWLPRGAWGRGRTDKSLSVRIGDFGFPNSGGDVVIVEWIQWRIM